MIITKKHITEVKEIIKKRDIITFTKAKKITRVYNAIFKQSNYDITPQTINHKINKLKKHLKL